MPYEYEERTFTIEIEVTARAHIETGGGYDDEPPWAEITDIEIEQVDVGNNIVVAIGYAMKLALRAAAYEEFEE